MTTRQEFSAVESVYGQFEEPLPDRIQQATAALDAATAARAIVFAQTEPPIDVSTPKAVAASIDKIALYRATADHRRAIVDSIHRAAEDAELTAWHQCEQELHAHLKPWFDATVKKFTDALNRLDGCTDIAENVNAGRGDQHAEAERLAGILQSIRLARSKMHGRLGSQDTPFWRWAQIVTMPDRSTAMRLASAVKGRRFEPDPSEGSMQWWAQLAAVPGVHLEYHSPAEQAELYARLPNQAPHIKANEPTSISA